MKKQIITFFLLFISFFGHCQFGPNDDAVYLDSLNNIGNEENFKYIRVIKDFTQKKDLYDVSFYNRSGKLERRGNVTNKFLMTNEGLWIYFYENGNRKRIVNYSNKKINGKQFEWYENGHLRLESDVIYDKKTKKSTTKIIHYWNSNNEQKVINGEGEYEDMEIHNMTSKSPNTIYSKGLIRNFTKEGIWIGNSPQDKFNFTEEFSNGKLVSGTRIDSLGVKTTYTEIETKPKPKKGIEDFYKFIGNNFNTPNMIGLNGEIYLSFIIEKDGSINDIRILRDIGFGTGDEAIRVLSKYEKWLPGKQRGVPVRVMYSLPITIQYRF